jgi:hypothetical protein
MKVDMIARALITGVAVLFLATGAARADEFVMLIQKGDEKPSTAFATMGMKIHCPPNMVGKLPYHSLETPESGKTC